MTLFDSEADASAHAPLHDHADYRSLSLDAPLNRFVDFLAHNVSAQAAPEYLLEFDSVFNVPLQVDLANFLRDLSLRSASGNNLGLNLSQILVMSDESLDAIDCLHATLLLFDVLPVRQDMGIVRVELRHEGHVSFLLRLQVSAPSERFLTP